MTREDKIKKVEGIILKGKLWGLVSAKYGVDLAQQSKKELVVAIVDSVELDEGDIYNLIGESKLYQGFSYGGAVFREGLRHQLATALHQSGAWRVK